MRKWLVRAAVLVLLAAAAVTLRLTAFAPAPVAVLVAPAEPGVVEATVTNSRAGTVRARRRAKLSPEVGGQVARLPFKEGDRVRAGELLLLLDDRSQRAHVALAVQERAAAEAEQERSCVAAERAERERARLASLAASGIISADLLDEAESARRAAQAACSAAASGVARAAAAEEVARTALAKAELRAPFDGIVAEMATEVGEWVTPSPPALPVPPVLDVLDPASLYVSAPMDEVDSARILPDQLARVTVDSHRDRTFNGRVLRIAPYVLDLEQQNRTVEIEVALGEDALAAALLPGTSADVEVVLEVRPDALRIPTAALLQGDRVLVLAAGGRLEERRLAVGLRNWDFVEARGGLAAGERVVTSLDRPEVRAGARVVVVAQLP